MPLSTFEDTAFLGQEETIAIVNYEAATFLGEEQTAATNELTNFLTTQYLS